MILTKMNNVETSYRSKTSQKLKCISTKVWFL